MEIDLLIRLVGSIDPNSDATAGLRSRAYRSLGIDAGELPKTEKACREKLRAQLRSEIMAYSEFAGLPGIIPGLGPPAGQVEYAVPIPLAAISILGEKIARGCEYKYKNRKRLVSSPYGIRTLIRETDALPEPFASGSKLLDFGPGCQIRRVLFIDDTNTVWYFISIWQTLNLHVRIELETELLKAQQHFRKGHGFIPPEDRRMEISPYLRNLNQ